MTFGTVAASLGHLGSFFRRTLEAVADLPIRVLVTTGLRDELPDLPLLASVPVSYEAPDAPVRQAGNKFWSFTTLLATDVADPAERLARISETAVEAKEQLTLLGPDLMPAWLDLVPPFITEPGAKALIDRLRSASRTDLVDVNVLISNIRGPEEPWTLLGREVTDLYIDGPPSNGVGLNVMLWSYGDRLLLGILAFADALPDPAALTRHLESAFEDLRAAAVPAERLLRSKSRRHKTQTR